MLAEDLHVAGHPWWNDRNVFKDKVRRKKRKSRSPITGCITCWPARMSGKAELLFNLDKPLRCRDQREYPSP
jgi:hypothetical protein